MKNLMKLIGIIAIVAVIVFAMVSCNTGGGGGGGGQIPVKIRAFNNGGTKPSGARSVARAIGDSTTDTASFAPLNTFYTARGAEVGTGITPSKFKIYYRVVLCWKGDGFDDIKTEWGGINQHDFTQNLVINLGHDIPTDLTITAIEIRFIDSEAQPSEITFNSGGEKTLRFVNLAPTVGTVVCPESYVCYGNTKKLVQGHVPAPGVVGPGHEWGQPAPWYNMVIPFEPLYIPEYASELIIGFSWNLNGIIQEYTNGVGTNRFFFKNGFWNNLYLTASVQ